MTTTRRRQWLVPAGLIALSLVPVAAGAARLTQLAGGATVTSENARFFTAPMPVIIHIVGATVFCLLGAFQFAPTLRSGRNRWHRLSGRVLVPFGLAAATSGLWMAVYYDLPASDNAFVEFLRLVFGSLMVMSLVLGVVAIARRQVDRHRAWMMRGYAIGLGAGTQVLTVLPWVIIVGTPTSSVRAVLMGAGWIINLAVAEYFIRTHPTVESAKRPIRLSASSVR